MPDMTVLDLIRQLKQLPLDCTVLNGKPTSLGTLVSVRSLGTVKLIRVDDRNIPEYRQPLNNKDEPDKERIQFVVIR